MIDTDVKPGSRFERLQSYIAADPENLALIADAASAALDEGRSADAVAMVDRHALIAPLTPHLVNLLGLAALSEGRDADAAALFRSLLEAAGDDTGLRFNLAWALGRQGHHQDVVALVGQGRDHAPTATLAVRALHHLGRLDEALALGDAWDDAEGDAELWGALATVAVDAEDLERTARWAQRGRGSVDGMSALGVLSMGETRKEEARAWFERALAAKPDSARALMGLGSVLLEEGRTQEAARRFDAAAEIFGDHLGTWIAAGWAWLLAGEMAIARQRFERALALDDTFGEAHGGLAVLAVTQGRTDEATHRADVALRLDRKGLGGTLAQTLLLELKGDSATAERMRDIALNRPVGMGGQTIAQRLALAAGRRAKDD